MKIKELKKQAKEILGAQYNALEIDLWWAHVLHQTREWVFMNGDMQMAADLEAEFWRGVEELRRGRPLEQLTGHKEFYGLEFKVNGDVLIPRPETELVVDLAKDFIKKNFALKAAENKHREPMKNSELIYSEPVRVLDVGTGSGCIILALSCVVPTSLGVGIEISEAALKVANENAERLGLTKRVEMRQGDLLDGLEGEFDILLANLPYIGRTKFNFVAKDVADFEPELALYSGDDGLDLYRKMFGQILALPWRPRLMIGEFGFGQQGEILRLLEENFSIPAQNLGKKINFEIIADLAGIARVFVVNFI